MTYIIYKLNTTSFLKIVGWFYQVNDSILIRMQVIEIDSKVLKKSLNFLKKKSQLYARSMSFFLHLKDQVRNYHKHWYLGDSEHSKICTAP